MLTIKIITVGISLSFLASNAFSQKIEQFTDPRDGQLYHYVTYEYRNPSRISQKRYFSWMIENLNYELKGSWSIDTTISNTRLGRYYTWNQAMDACPSGWRLPTSEEWDYLMRALGNKTNDPAVAKMKSKTGWPDTENNTNISGLNVLPSGMFFKPQNRFDGVGRSASFWTSTSWRDPKRLAITKYISSENKIVNLPGDKNYSGYSVRCITGGEEDYNEEESPSVIEKTKSKTPLGINPFLQFIRNPIDIECGPNFNVEIKNTHPSHSIRSVVEIKGYSTDCKQKIDTKDIILKPGESKRLGYQNVNCAGSIFEKDCREVGYSIRSAEFFN